MNWRIWPESTAFWIRSSAFVNDASSTFVGSSPFASMTTATESAISVSIVTFPFRAGSSSSASIVSTGLPPVSFVFVAIPVIPDCQGRLYSRLGSKLGLASEGWRFEMFGIADLSASPPSPS